MEARGIDARGRSCLASMGIYLFNRQTLLNLLKKTDYQDFGREVFSCGDSHRKTCRSICFDGFWEDIGHDPGVLRNECPAHGNPARRFTFETFRRADLHAGRGICRRHASTAPTIIASLVGRWAAASKNGDSD